MLAGKHLFDEVTPQKLFAAHTGTPPPPFAERAPEVQVPADLERIVLRLLEKDPANRFPDAASLISAIDAFKMRVAMHGTLSLRKPNGPSAVEIPGSAIVGPDGQYLPKRPLIARSPPLWIAGAVVGGIAVLALVFALGRSSKTGVSPSASATADSGSPAPGIAPSRPPAPLSSGAALVPQSGLGARFVGAASAEPAEAATLLLDALDKSAPALEDRDTRAAAVRTATRAAEADAPDAAALFERLAKAGVRGIDVLYDVAASTDAPKASAKARAILERPEVLASASPALRIAFDLLRGDCQKRQFLFARAAAEGDERALAILSSMMPPACDPHASACCFTKHGELERAISTIGARTPH
jgi:hypothetical protein